MKTTTFFATGRGMFAVACSISAFCAMLAGCGGGDSTPSPTPTPTPAVTPTPAPVPTPTPDPTPTPSPDPTPTPVPTPSPDPTPVPFTTTASGLQYRDEVVGEGRLPVNRKRVAVHYVGTFPDGTKFDSSRDRGTPYVFTIGVGAVIKGWDEGVAGMKEGGRRTLICPPALAYGATGQGSIPPNATLHFDVELLEIEP